MIAIRKAYVSHGVVPVDGAPLFPGSSVYLHAKFDYRETREFARWQLLLQLLAGAVPDLFGSPVHGHQDGGERSIPLE